MAATAPSSTFGYGYEASTHAGNLPYYYTYTYDYDFPIPNRDDPRWEQGLEDKRYTVYAPEASSASKYGTVIDEPIPPVKPKPAPKPAPPAPLHRRAPFWLLILLFVVGFLAVLLMFSSRKAPAPTVYPSLR